VHQPAAARLDSDVCGDASGGDATKEGKKNL